MRKSQLSGLTPVEQRDQRDSTAAVDQLCFISVFNVIKLTKQVKINDKITHPVCLAVVMTVRCNTCTVKYRGVGLGSALVGPQDAAYPRFPPLREGGGYILVLEIN